MILDCILHWGLLLLVEFLVFLFSVCHVLWRLHCSEWLDAITIHQICMSFNIPLSGLVLILLLQFHISHFVVLEVIVHFFVSTNLNTSKLEIIPWLRENRFNIFPGLTRIWKSKMFFSTKGAYKCTRPEQEMSSLSLLTIETISVKIALIPFLS